jgi:predicted nucleic acid-binding protein
LSEATIKRSAELGKYGIKPMDSLHLAVTEIAGIDVFLTTDDAFLHAANRMNLNIKVANPVTFLIEVMQNER